MGKGKDKAKNGTDKESSGVKIPKPLRKAGKGALKLAREPVVAEIVAAALLSAAAALRGDKAAARLGKDGSKAAGKAGKAGAKAAAEAGREASKIGDSLRGLALDLARRTLDSWDRPAADPAATAATGKPKKKAGRGKRPVAAG
ncbi:MAG: hypothetical protein QOH81_1079 [Sphingomonadales bacterium]|jgi:hypothetical protein|nr:hypothetical protein [Sphingomonadales bacterium]